MADKTFSLFLLADLIKNKAINLKLQLTSRHVIKYDVTNPFQVISLGFKKTLIKQLLLSLYGAVMVIITIWNILLTCSTIRKYFYFLLNIMNRIFATQQLMRSRIFFLPIIGISRKMCKYVYFRFQKDKLNSSWLNDSSIWSIFRYSS